VVVNEAVITHNKINAITARKTIPAAIVRMPLQRFSAVCPTQRNIQTK